MFSVNTNTAAMQARQAFASASAAVAAVSARVSTGLKVAHPQDDGATWSIAQNMRARVASWQTADDSLSRGQSLLDVAEAGAGQVVDLLTSMRQKALALQDATLDARSRAAVTDDIKALVAQIDHVALDAEFSGRRPLADTLTQSTVTYSGSSYVIPSAPMTPSTLAGPLQPAAGGASQTFTRDAGPTAGRIDLYLQAYSVPDVLEIYQGGVRVAATGQPYAAGGGPVAAGQPVSGENVLSFDYNPAAGQSLQFQFNQNRDAANSLWMVEGAVLQSTASPLPTPTTYTSTSTVTTSVATTYDFVSDPNGGTEPVQARALTAQALGLNAIDWNDPGPLFSVIDSALQTATGAAAYFGERQQAFDQLIAQNHRTEDTLTQGVGNLVDADLAKDGARLQADQSRQQLATQALAIAAQAPQLILSLFH
jgi:flagellin